MNKDHLWACSYYIKQSFPCA